MQAPRTQMLVFEKLHKGGAGTETFETYFSSPLPFPPFFVGVHFVSLHRKIKVLFMLPVPASSFLYQAGFFWNGDSDY
eukprot:5875897-Amphidinium_carterae.1